MQVNLIVLDAKGKTGFFIEWKKQEANLGFFSLNVYFITNY